MRGAIALAVTLAITLGLMAPAALADDNSVYGAYVSRDADFAKLGKQVRRGLRTWNRSGRKKSKPALRALRKTVKACDELIAAIKAEQPSSEHGKKGKAAAIASVAFIRKSAVTAAKAVRAGTRGHNAKANKLFRQADRQLKRAGDKEKTARREFKAAGVQVKPA